VKDLPTALVDISQERPFEVRAFGTHVCEDSRLLFIEPGCPNLHRLVDHSLYALPRTIATFPNRHLTSPFAPTGDLQPLAEKKALLRVADTPHRL
jgi:hypothetical protein